MIQLRLFLGDLRDAPRDTANCGQLPLGLGWDTLGFMQKCGLKFLYPVGDCLETLEEIAIEGQQIFKDAGGGEYNYIPCLNERHDWLSTLTDMALNTLDKPQ